MTLEEIVRWLVPAVVVFGVAGLGAGTLVWSLRRARGGPRARARAEAERARAGVALVALDDAVEELELEVALSGALYDGTAPAALRRARLTAQRIRDEAFGRLRDLAPDAHPEEVRRVALSLHGRTSQATAQIAAARQEHAQWMSANQSAGEQVARARTRLEALRAEAGDVDALVAEVAGRFDPEEVADAEQAAAEVTAALAEVATLLTEADEAAQDPTRSALAALGRAERALRRGQQAARTLEERHRALLDAAQGVAGEIAAAREAVRQAETLRAQAEPEDAQRLGRELRAVADAVDALEPQAGRRPTATVTALARLRDRLDLAVGDARTAQQRLRGARSALPGTVAAARTAVAHAEAVAGHAGADARVRLAAARHELAASRSAHDPVEALDAARRAMRHAEDAAALAAYERQTGRATID